MRKHILFALLALLAGFQLLNAIPAYPGKIEYVQPDGTKIVLRQPTGRPTPPAAWFPCRPTVITVPLRESL